ncbi:MAG: type IX secretion system membrane protein PorP/SprF, partial [Crocinitomicaceae bacterium]
STSNMQWGSQYSGLNFDPSLYDGEGIEYLPQQYSDFSAGIGYWYHKNDRNVAFAAAQDAKVGLAVYHINRPENAFVVSGNSRIPMRFVFRASALLETPAQSLYVYPNLTAQFQGPQHQFLFGALMKYTLKSGSKMTGMTTDMAITGGVNFRVNNVFDAVVPQFFFDFQAFSVGMSYDINVSVLNAASSYRGGFELSLRFTNPDRYTHKNPQRKGVSI